MQAVLQRMAEVYPAQPTDSPQEWINRFTEAVDFEAWTLLTADDERAVIAMMREQPPWEAVIDLERIDRAPFPKLILSGGWHPAFGAVCDVLETRFHARRVDFAGVGHSLAGHRDRWLPLLREFWESAPPV